MEKFFFKTTVEGKCLKRCLYRKDNTMIGSIECNRCEYNKGFDNFYNWVRCVFYSIHTENYNLYKKLKKYEDKVKQLENENNALRNAYNYSIKEQINLEEQIDLLKGGE